VVLLVLYPLLSLNMYTYMLGQRRKKLGAGAAAVGTEGKKRK
jgi:hypothetical protein